MIFMGSSINKFIELLVKGDFFLVFLIIMAIIIISVIVYLIKLQITDNSYYMDDEDEEDGDNYFDEVVLPKKESIIKTEFPKEEKITEEVINDTIEELKGDTNKVIVENLEKEFSNENKTPKIEQSKFDFIIENEEAVDTEQLIDSIDESLKVEESIKSADIKEEVKKFESDQEEFAIISASELENRLNEMKANGELERHEEEMKAYEEEQELKAIISYDELLKRANNNVITYESEENVGGLRVGKVDTKDMEMPREESNKPYYEEETFLKTLKEFRSSL